MFVPVWLLIVFVLFTAAVLAWAVLLAQGRNPLPVPDPGSRIFAAASPAAREAVVALLARHGLRERMRVDTDQVQRSILTDGTGPKPRPVSCATAASAPRWCAMSNRACRSPSY